MTAKHILAFRHVPFEGAGRLAPVLEDHSIEVRYVDLYQNGALVPDMSKAAGLLFLGGPMSVNDPLPYLACEMELIRRAAESGMPVLGICLGSQLIAKALGANVYRNPLKEIGFYDIEFTKAGLADRVFSGVRPVETVFHWHGETFSLPPGAELLASSQACLNQAVRFSATVYGMQFHLEVTPEMIADWCQQDGNCGDVRELDRPPDPGLHDERLHVLSRLVFGQWSKLL